MLWAHIPVWFFHFALALFLIVLLMPYNCVPGCTKSYAQESNLRNHQSTCSIAQTQWAVICNLHGSEGHKSLNERALSSLDDKKNMWVMLNFWLRDRIFKVITRVGMAAIATNNRLQQLAAPCISYRRWMLIPIRVRICLLPLLQLLQGPVTPIEAVQLLVQYKIGSLNPWPLFSLHTKL